MKIREDKRINIIMVNKDWGSSVLWGRSSTGGMANYSSYEHFGFPSWLIERFDYWSNWYESNIPENISDSLDWDSFEAYGLSLAIDIKRLVGDKFVVYYGHDQEVILPELSVFQYSEANCTKMTKLFFSDGVKEPVTKIKVMADYEMSTFDHEGAAFRLESIGVPLDITSKFSEWEDWWMQGVKNRNYFNVKEFDKRGLELANKLKNFVGPDVLVIYFSEENHAEIEIVEAQGH